MMTTDAPLTFAAYAATKGVTPPRRVDTSALLQQLLRDVAWSTFNLGFTESAALSAYLRFVLDDELVAELLTQAERALTRARTAQPTSRQAADR